MKDFRNNMTNLFDIIVKKANEIKEEAAKQKHLETNENENTMVQNLRDAANQF